MDPHVLRDATESFFLFNLQIFKFTPTVMTILTRL